MEYVALGIGLILIAILISKSGNKTKQETKTNESALYKKKPISEPEQVMYFRLKKALPEYEVLAQVSFSRFLYAKGGNKKQKYAKFATVRQKVVDFLICEKNFEIIAAIEIDDKTHNKEKDLERDKMLLAAGIPSIRWNVKKLPTEEEIQLKIKNTRLNNGNFDNIMSTP